MEAFGGLTEEKVQPEDRVMEGMAMGSVDPEDMGAAGALLEIGDMVLGKLLAQVETDHVEFG